MSLFSIDYFRRIFIVKYSDSNREKEEQAYIHFMDYVEECEGELLLEGACITC